MILDIQDILQRFCVMSGLPMEEAVNYTDVCTSAAAEIVRRLQNGGTVHEGNAVRLQETAACLAFYRYTLYRAAGEENFTVGDITVSGSPADRVKLAREIWQEAKHAAADLLQDDEFLFQGMQP